MATLSEWDDQISLRDLKAGGWDTQVWWVTSDHGAYGNDNSGPLRGWKHNHNIFLPYVKGRKTVVQAGGNCGMYALFLSKLFEQVYTFEPHPRNFECLRRNIELADNITAQNVALGQEAGTGTVFGGSDRNVGTYKVDSSGNHDGKPTEIITIDSLNLESCDLIYLDLEGFEPFAIAGSIETINKFKPVVIVERNSGSKDLEKLGYKEASERLIDDNLWIHESQLPKEKEYK